MLLIPPNLKHSLLSLDNRPNAYMFRDAMLKLLLAETLPYKKLIED